MIQRRIYQDIKVYLYCFSKSYVALVSTDQHCVFDEKSKNRILGYYNLNALKERMTELLIRREKRTVLKQLPNVMQEDVYVRAGN